MDKEEQKCLPLLLNCFYYRETLFIVYELLRDNLYHMYARADRTRTLIFGPSPCCAREHALERAPHTRPAVPATSTSTSAGCQSTSRYAPECMHLWAEPLRRRPPSPLSPTLSAPLRRSVDRWSACRRSLGSASARSRLCTSTTSSTAIWCATLGSEPRRLREACSPAHLAFVSPISRNRRTS